jgi:transposase InsO family protein
VSFIDEHREEYGVEPICRVMSIAPSTYRRCKQLEKHPEKRSARAQRDEELSEAIRKYWETNRCVYGVRKVWHGMRRKRSGLARCTVERLMRRMGLRGVIRGRAPKTTNPGPAAKRPLDLVCRDFKATRPNELWVADLTYVPTWSGFVYVAFVIDAFGDRIVGWRASNSLRSDLALDALEQALYDRSTDERLVHHSDRGVQYTSIRYTERLAEAGLEPSVGSAGDSYDNALAETIIGLYKTEVIRRLGPWRGLEHVEIETLTWVSWFNEERLMERLGYLSPAEYEAQYEGQEAQAMGA